MTQVSRSVLYNFFFPGAKPTSGQFKTLIDSGFNFADDLGLLGLNNYDPALSYNLGDTVVENKIIYQANKVTTIGPFAPADWNWIAGGTSGSLEFKGPWNALNDIPSLASPTPIPPAGQFYVVNKAGNTSLSGITDWEIGDWAISAGTNWFKIDNSDLISGAQNTGAGAGISNGKTGTLINLKSFTSLDGSIDIKPNNTEINIAVAFDDTGTSATRSWTAFKTNSELAAKEPIITGSGNAGDYWNGLKVFTDFGTSARNTFLTGLSTVTNQVISATDTIIQAFGYLQKQITDLTNNFGSNVRSTLLTGLSLGTNQVISATDSIVQAFGYLQKQITDLGATVTSHVGNMANPHNVTKAQIGLPDVPNLKENLSAVTDPTTSDDNLLGYAIGSTWINTTARKSFICISAATGAAIWKETTNPASSVFGNDYLRVDSSAVISTIVVKPSFANYNYPPATPAGTFVLSTNSLVTRIGTYRLSWGCLVQTGTKAGQFQLKNITSAGPQVVGTVDIQGHNTTDVFPVTWSGNVVLTGSNQDFVIQFNTALAGQAVTIKQAWIEIFKISNAS
jgi:hypothetical protein